MEPNQQYALYDGDVGGPQQWIAHMRLTPELLQRLQQNPASVTIQLQAPGGGGGLARPTVRAATNKTSSVLTISDADADGDGEDQSVERYEMLSFTEDPKVNAVCAFRADRSTAAERVEEESGYSLYHVGSVFQKLIVQRMLDSTEKDRMKDRHAKSVLESKARASKFVAADEATGLRNTRSSRSKQLATKTVKLTHAPGYSAKRGASTSEEVTPIKKPKLRSALTDAAIQELQERIARGCVGTGESSVDETAADTSLQAPAKSMIFSSDSETEMNPEHLQLPVLDVSLQVDSKQLEQKEIPTKKTARKATAKTDQSLEPEVKSAAQHKSLHLTPNATTDAKAVEALKELPAAAAVSSPSAESKRIVENSRRVQAESTAAVAATIALPPVRTTNETKKRARPRLSRLPDVSFLPQPIQDICRRVSAYITRTAILDASDYASFAAEHDRFRAEWDALDKAYSIESILSDGAHFQLPFASTDEEKMRLRNLIQEADKKREGLLFVRDSMATIHKILASLQTSISTYEQKTQPT